MKARVAITTCAALFLSLGATAAFAEKFKMPPTKVSMEKCMEAALAKKDGEVVKLEFKMERGTPTYEFEIAGKDGKNWEYECDANTGEITEEEQEVDSPDDPLFKAKMKISEEEARKIALEKHPGEIVETEYEIESNGDASYEFDIKTADGKEVKLEVDATTGKIVEDDQEEIYQIGRE
ncbi:peptidase [Methylocaldum marinum]|uniref:Peptidase n=1 Tax=Methylocaldum marinum TaxID=1432792 RepID=A0A250L164_9GAMM|nr:PepSY domain-containing protein [Methylocaldum marinum]BBA35829.1 peptidase [Methylocaldum marinum]